MAKVFSWQLGDNLYGYLVKVNNNSYLTTTKIDNVQRLNNITAEVSGLTAASAETCFNAMATEAFQKYGVSVSWKPEYWQSGTTADYIVLTGSENCSGGGSSTGGSSSSISEEAFEEFQRYIDACIADAESRIINSNAETKKQIEAAASKDVMSAIEAVNEAKKELNKVNKEAVESLSAATSALDAARSLWSGGSITAEAISDTMSKTKVVSDWVNQNAPSVCGMTFDYDEATKILAGGYTAKTVGAFSELAVGINTVSGSVGSVEHRMDACEGYVGDLATYVDTISGNVNTVKREMSALSGRITDSVTHAELSAEVTTVVTREMVAAEARITDKVLASAGSMISVVQREVNGLSGYIHDEIYIKLSGNVISAKDNIDALSGTCVRAITKADSALTQATDLRDEWSVASGMVRSVTDLVAETDSDGEVIYHYMNGSKQESTDPRVYRNPKDGKYYTDETYTTPVADESRVYVNYCTKMGSYIKQTSSSMTLSVMSDTGAMGTAINMCINEQGTGTMDLIADKITMDADVIIGGGLSAKTANLGGIYIGNGQVYSTKDISSEPAFKLDGSTGKLTAQDAEIKGKIEAESGSIGGLEISNNTISSSNGNFSIDKDGLLVAKNAQINGGITASTTDKTTIMDANTFMVSGASASISIEILPEWSGLTNVPVLCMTFGGTKYVLTPGSWQQAGGGTYAVVKTYKYNTAFTASTIATIKSDLQKLQQKETTAMTAADVTAASQYCKTLTQSGTLWKIERATSGTIPSELLPFIGRYVTVNPNVSYIDSNNMATVISTITGKLANLNHLVCNAAQTEDSQSWYDNRFCTANNGNSFTAQTTALTTTFSTDGRVYSIVDGGENYEFGYRWAKAQIASHTPSGPFYKTRVYTIDESEDNEFFKNEEGWGYYYY